MVVIGRRRGTASWLSRSVALVKCYLDRRGCFEGGERQLGNGSDSWPCCCPYPPLSSTPPSSLGDPCPFSGLLRFGLKRFWQCDPIKSVVTVDAGQARTCLQMQGLSMSGNGNHSITKNREAVNVKQGRHGLDHLHTMLFNTDSPA